MDTKTGNSNRVALLGIVVAVLAIVVAPFNPVLMERLGVKEQPTEVAATQKPLRVEVVKLPEGPNEPQHSERVPPKVTDADSKPSYPNSKEHSDPDRVAITEFRWMLEVAFNELIATGDLTALLNLSIRKFIALSPDQQRDMATLRKLVPQISAEREAKAVFNFTSWEIVSMDGQTASIAFESSIRGKESGGPVEEKTTSGKINLAKMRGEWLLASGAKLF